MLWDIMTYRRFAPATLSFSIVISTKFSHFSIIAYRESGPVMCYLSKFVHAFIFPNIYSFTIIMYRVVGSSMCYFFKVDCNILAYRIYVPYMLPCSLIIFSAPNSKVYCANMVYILSVPSMLSS